MLSFATFFTNSVLNDPNADHLLVWYSAQVKFVISFLKQIVSFLSFTELLQVMLFFPHLAMCDSGMRSFWYLIPTLKFMVRSNVWGLMYFHKRMMIVSVTQRVVSHCECNSTGVSSQAHPKVRSQGQRFSSV
jgi:hypothetical protein